MARITNGQVTDESAYHVVQLHVAIQVDVPAEPHTQRIFRQSHGVQVYFTDVGC